MHFLAHVSKVLALLLALFAQSASASATPDILTSTAVSEEMLFADDPKDWAKPRYVVPPDYPQGLLQKKIGGFVDVEVRISGHGEVTSARLVKQEPDGAGFWEATNEVIKKWLFYSKLSSACVPEGTTANVRLWFEPRDDKGVISVSGDVTATKESFAKPLQRKWINQKEVARSIRYPLLARSEGIEATLHVVAKVDAAGSVQTTEISHFFSGRLATNKMRSTFEKAVIENVQKAKFEPLENGKTTKVCIPYQFLLR